MVRSLKIRFISAAVALTMASSVLIMHPYESLASKVTIDDILVGISPVSQDEIDQKKSERDRARSEADSYQATANALRGEAGELKGELQKLNGLSEEQHKQYEEIARQLAAALIAKAEALDAYVDAQENLEQTRLRFSERVSKLFEYQNKSTLEVLLESDSIAGFFTNIEMISLIADSDAQAVDQMQIALDEADIASKHALKEAEDMEEIATEKQAQLKELEDRIGKTTAALDDVNTKIAAADRQEAELDAYADSLDSQIRDLQDQLYRQQLAEEQARQEEQRRREEEERAKQTQSTSSDTNETQSGTNETKETSAPQATATPVPKKSTNASLSWPTWTNWVTSPFGSRVHPIYGDVRFHAGIDIGAGMGDAVMAAASGTVIEVSYPYPDSNDGGDAGYGNYVVIDHGNGLSTLYAHMRKITVSVGDSVSTGNQLGEVGNTGGSRGAHLHFEVRVWGEKKDPETYLP